MLNRRTVKFRRGFFNTIKSDAGFSVKDRSLSGYAEYLENNRRAIISIYNDFNQARAFLRNDTIIKWKSPYDAEVVSEEKRQEILQNVFDALRFNTCPIEMV